MIVLRDISSNLFEQILKFLQVRLKGNLINLFFDSNKFQEATQLAVEIGNRSLEGRCMCSLADIYRELGESEAKETITVILKFKIYKLNIEI